MGTLKIGVVGYSTQKFDVSKANQLLGVAFDAVLTAFPDATDIWVVSGLTNMGIPALAYRAAVARGWKTSGIAPARVELKVRDDDGRLKNKYILFPVDERKIVGENWGDESQAFLDEINALVRIGGGDQSLDEVEKFTEQHGPQVVFPYELEAIAS